MEPILSGTARTTNADRQENISLSKDKKSPLFIPSLTDEITSEVTANAQRNIAVETLPTQRQSFQSGNLSLDEIRANYLVNLDVPAKPQPVALEVLGKNYSAPIAVYGGLTLVTAKAKAGKTFAHSLLVSALLKGGELHGKIRSHFIPDAPSRRKVAVFDTEQSAYDAHRIGKRIQHLAGDDARIEIYKLRELANDQKRSVIEKILYADEEICAVVIDGVRDLLFDINNPEESSKLVTDVLRWAEELGIAIIVILHQNKGDNNARGHVGSEFKNKAEIIANVTKDKEEGVYLIEAEDSRSREFEPIAFRIDGHGIPITINDYNPAPKDGAKRELMAHQIPDETHREVLRTIFSTLQPTYNELIQAISNEFEKCGARFGEGKAKKFKTYYTSKGWIEPYKEEGKKYPFYRLA